MRISPKLLCGLLSFVTASIAADLTAGVKAYDIKEFAKAASELMPLAESGDATAQYYIGCMNFFGQGLPQDYRAGIEWYTAAAEQGHTHAAAMLGSLYNYGPNVPWHSQVPTDLVAAVKWLRFAVKGDDQSGESTLATLYRIGRGVPKDLEEAARLYRLAAEQGDSDSQASLGFLYVSGDGVVKDYVQAHMWLNLCAVHSSSPGIASVDPCRDGREALEAMMTPAQIAEAQSLARNWKPRKQQPAQ